MHKFHVCRNGKHVFTYPKVNKAIETAHAFVDTGKDMVSIRVNISTKAIILYRCEPYRMGWRLIGTKRQTMVHPNYIK